MVVSSYQSKHNSAPASSLDYLSLENLSISSAREHLGVTDEDISLYVHFPVELQQEEEVLEAQKRPFHVWYVKDEVWPSCADTHEQYERGACNCHTRTCDCLIRSPSSPISSPSHNKRGTWQSPPTKRESLLQEAWQRKQELYLKQELANLEECTNVRMLGRSASDCSTLKEGFWKQVKHERLERSMSDCSKSKEDAFITPSKLRRNRTRSLTDDDFQELKGCLDLGFRFDQSSIPDLCDTIPALEVFCGVNQYFQESLTASPVLQSSTASPTSWRVTNPGDDPEEVREKLRHWAHVVACSARLCY